MTEYHCDKPPLTQKNLQSRIDTFVLSAQQYQAQQKGTMQFATQQATSENGWDYAYTDVTAAPLVITDFQTGLDGDVLDIKDLLRNGTINFDGSNPFGSSGYLRLSQSTTTPTDSLLEFDSDGTGDSFVTLAIIQNTITSAFTADNFNPGYSPDGSVPEGLVINGTELNDSLFGDAGSDTITAFAGADQIDADAGHDLVYAGDGNDTIEGSFGNDTLYGGFGNDTLLDSQGSNYLDGEDGEDTLTAKSLTGQHTLIGGLGNDTIEGVGLSLDVQGGDGVDQIDIHGDLNINGTTSYVQHGQATISGGAGDDQGYFSYYEDGGYWYGSGGLTARYMEDVVIRGDEGNDQLNIEYSKTALLQGGSGNDFLNAYFDGWALEKIGTEYGTNYSLDGGADDDIIQVRGYAYDFYGTVDLSLEGGSGNDTLLVSTQSPEEEYIGISSAALSGGDGNDWIEARGVLNLTLTGGSGIDTFVLSAQQYQTQQKGTMQFATQQATSENGWDYAYTDVTAAPLVITDFEAGRNGEKLDIRDLLQNGASNYVGTNPFKSGHFDIEQVDLDTHLLFDANGGGDNFVTLAVLNDVKWTELVAANFSPLFGTPNGDIMSGLKGDKVAHDGMGGNDKMVSAAIAIDALDQNFDQALTDNLAALAADVEDNIFDGGEGVDSMAGGAGDDTYYVDNVADVIREFAGQGGADKVIAAVDYALGENLEDLEFGAAAAAGTKGVGNAANNVMRANDKGNELEGGGGNDQLFGGAGNDRLYAADGDDIVDAGAGDDILIGGDGAGNDTYIGGEGIDQVIYTSAVFAINVDLSAGTASGADIGEDSLSGIENLVAGQAGDTLRGNELANAIDAYTGDDTVYASQGGDTITLGTGADTIIYTDSNQFGDLITDFSADDTINLSQLTSELINSGTSAEELVSIVQDGVDTLIQLTLNSVTETIAVLEGVDANGIDIHQLVLSNPAFSGQVFEWSSQKVLSNAQINIETKTVSVSFSDLESGEVINTEDALAALKIALGINPNPSVTAESVAVSPYQLIAADINQDGRVTGLDALAILKMASGDPAAPDREWRYVSDQTDFWDESSDTYLIDDKNIDWSEINAGIASLTTDDNVVAILAGDVNGSWDDPTASSVPITYFDDLALSGIASPDQWFVG